MSTTNILDLNNRIEELSESYPADKVILSDGVTSVEDALDSMRFYTINIPATAIKTLWVNPIYYSTIILDAPENLVDKKVFMCFVRTADTIIIGWSARVMPDGTKIEFSMCRANDSGTVSGNLHLIVKD